MTDREEREERQHVIEVLQNMVDWMEAINYIVATPERRHALGYAIASIETDLKYDLLYEETSEQADKPTTKNNLGVDAISRVEVIDYLCKHCPDDGECFKDCDEIKHLRQMPPVTPQVSSGFDKNSKKLEKDFGELDCISRSDVLKLMQDNWNIYSGDLAMQESMDDIRALPAVTPEPRKITLEDVKGYCEPRCLTIISNELLYELTHPKIKALEQESASTQEYGLTDADTDKYAVQVQNGEGYYSSFGRYVSHDLD